MKETVYKHRMDFYYQSLVIYLLFFIVYVLIRWSSEDNFGILFNDPIFYILVIFITVFLIIVTVNLIRAPMIILKSDRIIFKNRFGSREVMFSDIMNVKIGRRRNRNEEITYRIIKLKLKHRRKQFKIRANDFERGNELIQEFIRIKESQ